MLDVALSAATAPAGETLPDDHNALLTREQTAKALTAAGNTLLTPRRWRLALIALRCATLATKATRGGGPPYQLFGSKPLYRWGEALAWAKSRLSAPRRSTSEPEHRRAA